MEKKIAGLMGALAAAGTLSTAGAAPVPTAPAEVLQAASYADLLEPIPNAANVLRAIDTQPQQPKVQEAQFYYHDHHHHHHHHHHMYRRAYPLVVPPWRYRGYYYDHHHHHHHHHHHSYYDRY